MLKKAVLVLAAGLILTATAARAGTLDQIKKRGFLTCGSNPGLAGFGLPDGNGHWAGLDADFCRALAAAIFNDAGKVRFVPLAAKDRFRLTPVKSTNQIDRNVFAHRPHRSFRFLKSLEDFGYIAK